MLFKVNLKIFTDFDDPVIGVIVARDIDNTGNHSEIDRLLREAEANLREKLNGMEISEHPHLAPWRETYRRFGSKPKEYKCSVEALARIVLRGLEIRKISPLVDLYNLVSIKYLVPVGAEDLDKMQGDLELTFADGSEDYIPLGGEENDPPRPGEVIYRDDVGVICRRWNWREGDRTKITGGTKNAILVLESVASIPLQEAVEELAGLVKKYCGGEIAVHYLDRNLSELDLNARKD